MKSGTSFFNRGVLVKSVLRFWPIWAVYAFVQLLVLPMNLVSALGGELNDSVNRYVLEAVYASQVICPIACCAAAMAVFSHLYSDRAAGFYSALPVSRSAMFVSLSLAGVLPLLAANVIVFLATLAEEALFGFAGTGALLEWLGAVSLMTVAYFGIAVLCAQLTGHIVVMPVLFVAFGVVVSWLGQMALVVPGMFCYGYVSAGAGVADLFSPFVCLSQNLGINKLASGVYELYGWPYLIAYGLLGLALLPASGALYLRRNMESAGDVVAIAPLRPVFQLICSFAAAFILGNLFYTLPFGETPSDGVGPAAVYVLCMAAAAFLGWFCAAMLVNKSFAVFNAAGRYIGWGLVCVVCAALVFTCELDVTGYESRVPDAEDVAFVHVTGDGVGVDFDEPENIETVIAIHESAVAARDENEYARAHGCSTIGLYLNYKLKNGDKLVREYRIASNGEADTLELMQELMNSAEGIAGRKELGVVMNGNTVKGGRVTAVNSETGEVESILELTEQEALELYQECILPDMQDKTIGLVWYRTDAEYYDSVYDCRIEIDVQYRDASYMFYTVPTIWSVRTNDWLLEHGAQLRLLDESAA